MSEQVGQLYRNSFEQSNSEMTWFLAPKGALEMQMSVHLSVRHIMLPRVSQESPKSLQRTPKESPKEPPENPKDNIFRSQSTTCAC